MPAWMHQRAEHILAKNPSMPKGEAFAIATQQSHALGKSPKNYGTSEGRETAKMKYDTPKDDKKTANPGGLTSEKMAFDQALCNEFSKIVLAAEEKKQTLGDKALRAGKAVAPAALLGAGLIAGSTVGMRLAKRFARHVDHSKTRKAVENATEGVWQATGGNKHIDNRIKVRFKEAGVFGEELLELLSKEGGLLKEVWDTVNTPIAGTPKLIAGRNLGSLARESTDVAKKVAPAVAKTKEQVMAARRASWRPTGVPKTAAFEEAVKAAFTISQYSGPLSMGRFKMESGLPNKPAPSLQESPVEVKKAGVMTASGVTPAARLSSSMHIGAPKVTAPSGPSIAQIAKPNGFGKPIAGATLSQ